MKRKIKKQVLALSLFCVLVLEVSFIYVSSVLT